MHVLLLMAGLLALARAQTGTLTCIDSPSSGIYQRCSDTGTLGVGANTTYLYMVSDDAANEQSFDLNITLTTACC